jgi:hypothetical protein
MLNVNNAECRKIGLYAECHYTECLYAECRDPCNINPRPNLRSKYLALQCFLTKPTLKKCQILQAFQFGIFPQASVVAELLEFL